MNNILKIALDHPAKAEKIVLWVLQSLITLWCISHFISIDFTGCFKNEFSISKCIKSVDPLVIATTLVTFVVAYYLLWETLIDLFFKFIFFMLNWIVERVIKIALNSLLLTLYGILYIVSLVLPKYKPNKYWKSEKNINYSEAYRNKVEIENELEIFKKIDSITKGAYGSELLLTILSHEKSFQVRSRIIRYFSILTILLVLNSIYSSFLNTEILSFLWVIIILIGLALFALNSVFEKIDYSIKKSIVPRLKYKVFIEEVKNAVKPLFILNYYNVNTKRKKIILSLKKEVSTLPIFKNHYNEIEIIPMDLEIMDFNELLARTKSNKEKLLVFVCNSIPDNYTINQIVDKEYSLVYGTKEDDIYDALSKIKPVFKKDNFDN